MLLLLFYLRERQFVEWDRIQSHLQIHRQVQIRPHLVTNGI